MFGASTPQPDTAQPSTPKNTSNPETNDDEQQATFTQVNQALNKMRDSENSSSNGSDSKSSKHLSVIDQLETFWEENDEKYRD